MIKNILVLLLFSSFMFGLDLDLECSLSNTSSLFAEYKKLSKKSHDLLKDISQARRDGDIKKAKNLLDNNLTKVKKALKRKSKAIQCATNQLRAKKINFDELQNYLDGLNIGSRAYKLAEYLKEQKNTKALKKLVKFINENRADDLKYIEWKGGKIFALDIGYKAQYPNKFYVGFFYTLGKDKISYIQYTADSEYFQKNKRIKLSSLSKLVTKINYRFLKLQLRNTRSQIVLAYILENWLGLPPEYSLQSYLNNNKIKFEFSKNSGFSQIKASKLKYGVIVAVKGITPTLDEVANYLRSGSYTLRIRSSFQDELVFENGKSQITIYFPTKNPVVIKKKTHNYVAEDDSTVLEENSELGNYYDENEADSKKYIVCNTWTGTKQKWGPFTNKVECNNKKANQGNGFKCILTTEECKKENGEIE
jgi:hypothetical protein